MREDGEKKPNMPNRYWIVITMMLFCVAKYEPSRPGAVEEPEMKLPPWIHTITGIGAAFEVDEAGEGRYTFIQRQSSLTPSSAMPYRESGSCIHSFGSCEASYTPPPVPLNEVSG